MGIFRNKPNAGSFDQPGDAAPGRHTNYGDAYVNPVGSSRNNLADEGSYYSFITPTPGTGIVAGVVTTFVETTPFLVINNGTSNQRLVLDFIRLTTTVAPVGGSQPWHTYTIDRGNRYSSGGTALTISNTNSGADSASGLTAYTGAITASAATANRRVISHLMWRHALIGIIGDVYETVFGHEGPATNNTQATTLMNVVKNVPPLVLAPGDSFVAVQWGASQSTAPTYAVEGGFWLR